MATFYFDVHRTAEGRKRNRKVKNRHIVFDGSDYVEVEKLTEIPVKTGDRLSVDVYPLNLTDQLLELLKRGAEMYALRRLTDIRRVRKGVDLSKTHKNDARVLSLMPECWFKRLN